MSVRRVLVALLLLSLAAPAALSKQKNISECCAPPAALSEVESKVSELANAAGECPTADEAGLARAKKDFAEYFPKGSSTIEADVHGIKLSGTKEQLDFAKQIVGGNPKSDDERLPSTWPTAASGCTEVVCALSKLFGSEESALRVLNVAKRTGYFITASQAQNRAGAEQIWSASEIRVIDGVTRKMPETFRRLSSMKYFYRVHDGDTYAEYPTAAARAVTDWGHDGGRIIVYEDTFQDEAFATSTILHEVAHHLDYSGDDLSQSTGFSKLSGWDDGKKKQNGADADGNPKYKTVYTPGRTDNFVSDYARTSPSEDWAETVADYIYAPEILKNVAPEKYALMKEKIFGGKEYQDEPWPALEQAIKSGGGTSGLVFECMERFTGIYPNDEAAVHEITKEEDGFVYWRGRSAEELPLRTGCLRKNAEQIAQALKTDPSFCDRGGVIAIEDALRKKIVWPLRSILVTSVDAAKEAAKTTEQRCFEKKDFTRPCAIGKDAIKAALLANSEFSALPETTRKQVGERILNLIASPGLTAAVLKEFTPARTLQACLMGVDVIHASEDGVFYHTDMLESSGGIMERWTEVASGVSAAKGCTRNLEKKWRASGYIVDTPAEGLAADVLKNERMVEIVKAFENEVVLKWSASLKSCGGESERPSCMEGVIKGWAEKHKLGAEIDAPALTARLLKTVQLE